MDPRVTALAEMLRLNGRLYQNCLAGLTDQAARERLAGPGATNSAAFVAAHLVDSRYYLLDCLGVKQASPLTGAKGGFNNIADVTDFPPLAAVRAAWHTAGELLGQRLAALTAAELDTPSSPASRSRPRPSWACSPSWCSTRATTWASWACSGSTADCRRWRTTELRGLRGRQGEKGTGNGKRVTPDA